MKISFGNLFASTAVACYLCSELVHCSSLTTMDTQQVPNQNPIQNTESETKASNSSFKNISSTKTDLHDTNVVHTNTESGLLIDSEKGAGDATTGISVHNMASQKSSIKLFISEEINVEFDSMKKRTLSYSNRFIENPKILKEVESALNDSIEFIKRNDVENYVKKINFLIGPNGTLARGMQWLKVRARNQFDMKLADEVSETIMLYYIVRAHIITFKSYFVQSNMFGFLKTQAYLSTRLADFGDIEGMSRENTLKDLKGILGLHLDHDSWKKLTNLEKLSKSAKKQYLTSVHIAASNGWKETTLELLRQEQVGGGSLARYAAFGAYNSKDDNFLEEVLELLKLKNQYDIETLARIYHQSLLDYRTSIQPGLENRWEKASVSDADILKHKIFERKEKFDPDYPPVYYTKLCGKSIFDLKLKGERLQFALWPKLKSLIYNSDSYGLFEFFLNEDLRGYRTIDTTKIDFEPGDFAERYCLVDQFSGPGYMLDHVREFFFKNLAEGTIQNDEESVLKFIDDKNIYLIGSNKLATEQLLLAAIKFEKVEMVEGIISKSERFFEQQHVLEFGTSILVEAARRSNKQIWNLIFHRVSSEYRPKLLEDVAGKVSGFIDRHMCELLINSFPQEGDLKKQVFLNILSGVVEEAKRSKNSSNGRIPNLKISQAIVIESAKLDGELTHEFWKVYFGKVLSVCFENQKYGLAEKILKQFKSDSYAVENGETLISDSLEIARGRFDIEIVEVLYENVDKSLKKSLGSMIGSLIEDWKKIIQSEGMEFKSESKMFETRLESVEKMIRQE
jgi:hypothetical protein